MSNPEFIFLNEVQIFMFDVDQVTPLFQGEYCHVTNTEDLHDKELGLIKNRAHGGTMILWKRNLDKYVTTLPILTSSFLPILFSPPGSPPSVHISLYLPTSGREAEFVEEISKLTVFLEDHLENNPEHIVYIRGDSNVNKNHKDRMRIMKHFMNTLNLMPAPIEHRTYHHFLGNGLFDSNIDVLLRSKSCLDESIREIFCRYEYPIIESHHDLILSSFTLPLDPVENPVACSPVPQIKNDRTKTIWSEENIPLYQELIADNLASLRSRWLNPKSRSSVSLLLKLTTDILSMAAASTNKTIDLSEPRKIRSTQVPLEIRKSHRRLKLKNKESRRLLRNLSVMNDLKDAKRKHRNLLRRHKNSENFKRDQQAFSILSSNPSSMYRKIKAMKNSTTEQIQMLKVGTKEYHGEDVKNGFFQSISDLKTREIEARNETLFDQIDDYRHILDICKMKRDLPDISLIDSTNILRKMKANVNDIYCVTTLHYINAGNDGIEHFNFLLNCIIDDVNNASIEELNSIYALLLHKGHGKPKTVSSAYRTISTCPLLSKAMDLYIRDLHIGKWNNQQAETQYQGEGSSHELAALLVTEVVQHSLFSLKEPAYLLFLDAKSAYDTVKPEKLIKNMYTAGMDGNTIVYMNQRLINRLTFLEWDKNLMGPIMDEHGLEQGGSNSGDLYKLYNNELLKTTQKSSLGVPLRKSQVISSVGQADDTVLTANKLANLSNLLVLTEDYCDKYSVTLCPDKTKLVRLTRVADTDMEMMNPIVINGTKIPFSDCAEHVGILRSTEGNLPHIMKRITSHKKALGAVMFAGLAQRHRANPAVGLKIERIYGNPVLMSGLASLVLSGQEQTLLDQHGKKNYQNLQKLHDKTPDSVVYFLAGCLPASAEIHRRQLSLFGMITRLTSDPLNIHAKNVLTRLIYYYVTAY